MSSWQAYWWCVAKQQYNHLNPPRSQMSEQRCWHFTLQQVQETILSSLLDFYWGLGARKWETGGKGTRHKNRGEVYAKTGGGGALNWLHTCCEELSHSSSRMWPRHEREDGSGKSQQMWDVFGFTHSEAFVVTSPAFSSRWVHHYLSPATRPALCGCDSEKNTSTTHRSFSANCFTHALCQTGISFMVHDSLVGGTQTCLQRLNSLSMDAELVPLVSPDWHFIGRRNPILP